MWTCVYCNAQNIAKHKFCVNCGSPQQSQTDNHCSNPECKAYKETLSDPKQKYCGICGSKTTYWKKVEDLL